MLLELIWKSILLLPAVFTQDFPAPRAGNFGNCPIPTDNDTILGRYDGFSDQGLLPSLFFSGGRPAPSLMIVRSKVTCLNTGFTSRFTASSVSFIVEYQRQDNQGVTIRAQVSVDCIPDPTNSAKFSFYPTPTGSNPRTTASVSFGSILRDNTDVPFSTELRVDCSECSELGTGPGDPIARCTGCADECNNMGSRRCVGLTQPSGQCCPYFLEDRCVLSCPNPLTPNDMTFECDCGILAVSNGVVSYSNAQTVGSVASYSCDSGYILEGSAFNRTCSLSGWSGTQPTCQRNTDINTGITAIPKSSCNCMDRHHYLRGMLTLIWSLLIGGSRLTISPLDQ